MIKFKTVLVCLLVVGFFWNCKKSPTTPEQPKPRAEIEVNVKDESKLTFYWYDWRGAWYTEFTVIVSENNGVGGTVTICQLIFSKEGNEVQTNTYSGGGFSAYGTCEVDCDPEVDEEWDKMTIKVKGSDYNGYSFEKSIYYTYGNATSYKGKLSQHK